MILPVSPEITPAIAVIIFIAISVAGSAAAVVFECIAWLIESLGGKGDE